MSRTSTMSASFFLRWGVLLLLVFLILITIGGTKARRRLHEDHDSDGYTNRESDCNSDFRTTNTNHSESHRQWQPATSSPRIINGYYTLPGQYPFVVRVEVSYARGVNGICTGTIIDSTTVLTAAHCVLVNEQKLLITNPAAVRVVVGDHRRGFNSSYAVSYKTKLIAIHRAYKFAKNFTSNDIGLIMTRDKIKFKKGDSHGYGRVDSVELPPRGGLVKKPGAKVTVAGWGQTTPGDPTSEALQLMALDTKFVPCSDPSVPKLINKEFVCLPFDGMRGMCHGDSGGPLFVQPPPDSRGRASKAVQYGVSNFVPGGKCAKAQSYYLDLSHFVSWINEAKRNINSKQYIVRKNTEL